MCSGFSGFRFFCGIESHESPLKDAAYARATTILDYVFRKGRRLRFSLPCVLWFKRISRVVLSYAFGVEPILNSRKRDINELKFGVSCTRLGDSI